MAEAVERLKEGGFLDEFLGDDEVSQDLPAAELFYSPAESIFSAVADDLVANGWSIFPQQQDRRPGIVHFRAIEWQRKHQLDERLPTEAELSLWKRHCPGENVACVMGPGSSYSFALDIDVSDEQLSRQIVELADEMLGYTPLRRIGSAPKIALFYRYPDGETISSISRHFVDYDDEGNPINSGHMLEVAAKGRLLTFYGKHHRTGRYFRWLDLNPLAVGPKAAPVVSSQRLEEFLERVDQDIKPFHRGASISHELTNWEWDDDRKIYIPGKPSSGGGFASWVENEEGRVVDGREAYLTALVFQVARLNPGLPAEQIAKISTEQFQATAVATGRWQGDRLVREALERARRLVRKVEEGDLSFSRTGSRSPRQGQAPAIQKTPLKVSEEVIDDCGLQFLKRKTSEPLPVRVTGERVDVSLSEEERRRRVNQVQEKLQAALRDFFRDVIGNTRIRMEEEGTGLPALEGDDAALMDGWQAADASAESLHILKAPTGAGKTSQTIRFIAKHRRALFPGRPTGERDELHNEIEEPLETYETETGAKLPGTRPIVFLLPTYANIDELQKRVQGMNLGGTDEEIRQAALEMGIIQEDQLETHLEDLKREAMRAGLKVMTYRGKVAAGCQIKDKIEVAQAAGINSSSLCRATRKREDGTTEEIFCEFYHSCPAIQQRNEIQQSHVVFMPHAFMNLNIPSELSDVKAVIVDERVHHLFLHTTTFPIGVLSLGRKPPRLTRQEREDNVLADDILQDRQEAAEIALDAMKQGDCPASALYLARNALGQGRGDHGFKLVQAALRVCGGGLKRDAEITPETTMERLQEICARPTGLNISEEYRFWKIIQERMNALVHDDLVEAEIIKLEKELASFQGAHDLDRRLRLERRLANLREMPRRCSGSRDMRIQFLRLHENSRIREVVRISWRTQPNWLGVPMLLLDASAAPEVIGKIWNGLKPKVHDIDGPLHVRVVGVVDQTFSNASLVGSADDTFDEKARVARRLNKVRGALSAISGYYGWGRVVCGASIVVRKAINNNWQGPANVDWCHYGAMRGLDFAKHHSAAFSVGRMEVPIHSIDGLVAALTYDDEVPEEPFDKAGTGRAEGDKPLLLPLGVQKLRMRDGRVVEVPTPMYPGKWGRLMQRQYREEELNQFVGRLRPVYREGEAPVWFALSSVIPEDYVIDHLIHIDSLVKDNDAYWDAIRRTGGIVEPNLLHTLNPDLFASPEAASKKMIALGFDLEGGTTTARASWGFVCLRWYEKKDPDTVRYAYVKAMYENHEEVLDDALRKHLKLDVEVERVGQGRSRTRALPRDPDKIDLELGDMSARAAKERKVMEDASVYVFEKGLPRSEHRGRVLYPVRFRMPKGGRMTYAEIEALFSIGDLWDRIQYEKSIANPLTAADGEAYDQLGNHVSDADAALVDAESY